MQTSPQALMRVCASVLCAFTFVTASFSQSPVAATQSAELASALTATPTPTPTLEADLQNPSKLTDKVKTYDRNAPRRENLTGFKVAHHINGLFGGFEQGAGFGFGVEFTTADSLHGVELRARALTSTKLYRKGEVGLYVPKLGSENSHADIFFTYLRRTKDSFFGLGPRTTDAFETNFDLEQRSISATYSYDVTKRIQLGGYLRQANTGIYRGEDKKDKPLDQLFTGNAATKEPLRFVPGLGTNLNVFTYGLYVEGNLRNNDKGLTKGFYIYERLSDHRGTGDRSKAYRWTEFESDLRGYLPLGSAWTSLAARSYLDVNKPTGSNDLIPFYEQAFLGGRSFVRGFDNYRFRANNLALFSLELRQTVWKQKDTRGVDIVGFGDGGQVWGDKRPNLPPQFNGDKFSDKNWRFGTGFGVQYRYNKALAVRLDYAHTNEANKIYFSLTRGF